MRLAVVAPCGVFDPVRFEAGLAVARSRGHEVVPFPGLRTPWRYLAAPDSTRRAHLVEALTAPGWDGVWIARGGYGLTRLIAELPLDRIDDRLVIGFSDVTALFAALPSRARCLHAPMPHSLPVSDDDSVERLFLALAGEPPAPLVGETWVSGTAEGPLVVGNLTLFAALCGTRFQPQWRGRIVVLEEIGEAPYRIDRLLTQLRMAGALDGVAGIGFGDFQGCEPPAGADYALRDVLVEGVAALGVPVVGNLPVGHGRRNAALPWGRTARLGEGRLTL